MKIITTLFLSACIVTSAHADGYRGHHGHHDHYRSASPSAWIAPMIIGGAIGYVISNQSRPQPQVVYTEPAPVYTRQPIYEERVQYDVNCDCYVKSYVQIGWR